MNPQHMVMLSTAMTGARDKQGNEPMRYQRDKRWMPQTRGHTARRTYAQALASFEAEKDRQIVPSTWPQGGSMILLPTHKNISPSAKVDHTRPHVTG